MVSLTKAMVKRTKLPVTVKTRLGWDESSIKIVEVAERLQDVGIKAIAIHGRTRAQMYKGNADWRPIAEVKNNPRMHIPVFGNGDVDTPEDAKRMRDEYGLDGAMIGRASIGYPWFFKEVKHFFETGTHLAPPTMEERVEAARRHLQMAIDWKGEKLGVFETRRHYTNYFKGIPNFKEYRMKMVTSDDSSDVFAAFDEVLEKFGSYQFELSGLKSRSDQFFANSTTCDFGSYESQNNYRSQHDQKVDRFQFYGIIDGPDLYPTENQLRAYQQNAYQNAYQPPGTCDHHSLDEIDAP